MCHPAWTSALVAAQRLKDFARLRRVRDRIDREYARPLDVEALARGAGMAAGHLGRQFRQAYGQSPYAYLMTRRVERAMALLRHRDLSVTEVCSEVGCSSPGTFGARFTELVGMAPGDYRRQSADGGANGAAGAVAGAAAGAAVLPTCVTEQATGTVRNREALVPVPSLAWQS
ncbi:AraC family transcriptional regulator [Streptomyces sp. NPDC046237]|uniref:helix-turn-helix transcriptional regulator n=1 Tax=Streptomyces sp. NPDC046237 TaxID=3154914 RepID=UPI0034105F74